MFGKRVVADGAGWIFFMYLTLPATPTVSEPDQSLCGKAWATLQSGLDDEKADRRAEAVSALGLMPGDERAMEAAEHALQDAAPSVRRAGITALGDMNATASLPKIKALVDQSDAETVVIIAAVLSKFKDPEAYDIYYEILTGKRKKGGSILDGLKDKKSLEKMGLESAIGFVPFGGIATGAYDYLMKNSSVHTNLDVIAVTALTDDPDPVVEKALVDSAFNGKEVVRLAALRALAKRGDPAVANDIELAMYSKPLIAYTAAAAILHLLGCPAKAAGAQETGSMRPGTEAPADTAPRRR